MAQELQVSRLASINKDLLSCIVCKQIAEQPLLLRCLHGCCSGCADSAAIAEGSNSLRCPACDVLTDISLKKHHNGFIAELVRRFKALQNADKCSACREDGSLDELADVWCMQCQRSLCAACLPGHNRYNKSHASVSLEQITSLNELLQAAVQQQCRQHSMPLDLLCIDCKKAACTDCARQCEVSGHSMPQLLKGPKAKSLLKATRERIRHMHEHLLSKSEQLLKPRNLEKDIRSVRAVHLDELRTKKKYVVDAVSKSFDDSESKLKDCYDQLEDSAAALQSLAEQLHQSLQHASEYASSLTDSAGDPDVLDQQVALQSRLEVLVKQMDGFRDIPDAGKLLELSGSLPNDINKVVSSWIGTPKLTTDCLGGILAEVIAVKGSAGGDDVAEEQPALHFGRASSSFQTPVPCRDLSVTSEGHLLLAAFEHGLKEYSKNGSELSVWKPMRRCNGEDDLVISVQSLQDGRAVVGVHYSQLVLLLTRSSAGAAAAAAGDWQWLEDKRVAVLQSPPWKLSVLGDLLAVTETRLNDQQQWWPGPGLQLLQLSTGQLLYSRKYDYDIEGVALTAAALVTTSRDNVKLDDGRELDIVDSYSHRGNRLWRHELSSKEAVGGVCTAGRLVYMAVQGRGDRRSRDCVRVLSAESGEGRKDLQHVLSYSIHGLEWPICLSLRDRGHRTVLAVLGQNRAIKQSRNVTVYPAADSS